MKNKMGGAKHAVTDAKNAAKHHVSGKARPDGTAHDGDPPPPPHPHPTPASAPLSLIPRLQPPPTSHYDTPHRARLLRPHGRVEQLTEKADPNPNLSPNPSPQPNLTRWPRRRTPSSRRM